MSDSTLLTALLQFKNKYRAQVYTLQMEDFTYLLAL